MTLKTTIHPEHEHEDINAALVARCAIALIVVCLIIGGAVWWMYGYVRTQDEARDVRRTLIPAASAIPPEPRIEVDPTEDFQKYKLEQERILNSYGWVSRDVGSVRIPIERAMDVIADRGLPPREKTGEKK